MPLLVRAGHSVSCARSAPLADTTVAGLIFDGVLFSTRSHRHLRAFCLWSGRRRPPCPRSTPGRLRSLC